MTVCSWVYGFTSKKWKRSIDILKYTEHRYSNTTRGIIEILALRARTPRSNTTLEHDSLFLSLWLCLEKVSCLETVRSLEYWREYRYSITHSIVTKTRTWRTKHTTSVRGRKRRRDVKLTSNQSCTFVLSSLALEFTSEHVLKSCLAFMKLLLTFHYNFKT